MLLSGSDAFQLQGSEAANMAGSIRFHTFPSSYGDITERLIRPSSDVCWHISPLDSAGSLCLYQPCFVPMIFGTSFAQASPYNIS